MRSVAKVAGKTERHIPRGKGECSLELTRGRASRMTNDHAFIIIHRHLPVICSLH